MRDVILIVAVILMFIGYAYVSEIISRCNRRKQNPQYGSVPNKPTPPPNPPKHFIITDPHDCVGLCKSEPTQVYPVPALRSYRYKNIWYDVTVQAEDGQHACQLINQIFKEKNQPLICFLDQLTIVE